MKISRTARRGRMKTTFGRLPRSCRRPDCGSRRRHLLDRVPFDASPKAGLMTSWCRRPRRPSNMRFRSGSTSCTSPRTRAAAIRRRSSGLYATAINCGARAICICDTRARHADGRAGAGAIRHAGGSEAVGREDSGGLARAQRSRAGDCEFHGGDYCRGELRSWVRHRASASAWATRRSIRCWSI